MGERGGGVGESGGGRRRRLGDCWREIGWG